MPGIFSSFPRGGMMSAMERRMKTQRRALEEEKEKEEKKRRQLGYNDSRISSTGSTNRLRSY